MRRERGSRTLNLRSFFLACTIALAGQFLMSSIAYASKFSLGAGFYNIDAETPNGQATLRNLGVYQLGFQYSILPSLELGVGYSVAMSNVVGGDLAFGVDLGVVYYPVTTSGETSWSTDSTLYGLKEIWRPYLGLSFHQRQFQAVQIGYAGFGLSVGTERTIRDYLALKGELRGLWMSGTSAATVLEVDGILGVVLTF